MKTTKTQIDQFFTPKQIAIAGVSRNEKKFGNQIFKHLQAAGYEILPINPNATEIDGVACFNNIESLPHTVESLLLATPKNTTDQNLKLALNKGIKNIWIQLDSFGEQTKELAQQSHTNIIFNKCIFMFSEPVNGVHKFHQFCTKLIGKYPK